MSQIFISAGHGGLENGVRDVGATIAGTTEAQEMIALRDLILPELRSRGYEVLSVPDDLSASQSIDWINARAESGSVALEIHAEKFSNQATRGATVYHIANNRERREQAELILLSLIKQVPTLPSRGVRPDTSSGTGRLQFVRQTLPPALLAEIAYLTNANDFALLTQRRRDFAIGLANGLSAWSDLISGTKPSRPTPPSPTPSGPTVPDDYPRINISINGGEPYAEQGILIKGNAYMPIDLADRLGVAITGQEISRVRYRGIVYIKAVDLKPFRVSVGWDAASRTLKLTTAAALNICPGTIDLIMSHGSTTEFHLTLFLRTENEKALELFPNLPALYREEATIEGVDYDIAFCQMCIETDFLRFAGPLRPEQNNFASLANGSGNLARFDSAQLGVRAQIQHLKAYASTEPLVRPQVDPRFEFVKRGVAPFVGQLSGLWSADPLYGQKILARLENLYKVAGIL